MALKNKLGITDFGELAREEERISQMPQSTFEEIKTLLKAALTDRIDDREVYRKGVDTSYHYEGCYAYKAQDLAP